MNTQPHTTFVVQLISERFSPFATIAGPLSAGPVELERRTGTLYLTQTRAWLFLGKAPDDVLTLTNEQLAAVATPIALIRSLLSSITATVAAFQAHLDLIELKSDDLTTLLGFYLSDTTATVVDAIALHRFNP